VVSKATKHSFFCLTLFKDWSLSNTLCGRRVLDSRGNLTGLGCFISLGRRDGRGEEEREEAALKSPYKCQTANSDQGHRNTHTYTPVIPHWATTDRQGKEKRLVLLFLFLRSEGFVANEAQKEGGRGRLHNYSDSGWG
jgi:hypothetical protein